jgi:hypothetical protein
LPLLLLSRADELLVRWRLEKAAGIPAERRLEALEPPLPEVA